MGCGGGVKKAMIKNISVVHKNNLSTYLGDWRTFQNVVLRKRPPLDIPQTFISFSENTYAFSLMLAYLDYNLRILEKIPSKTSQLNYMAYAEARVFLKTCYIFFRILLDDLSGIIEYFYKNNEHVELPKSFNKLLQKSKNGELPDDISEMLKRAIVWFQEMRERRKKIEHEYESPLISLKQRGNGKYTLGHFSIKKHSLSNYGNIREYFGYILCEYQIFIDDLLEFFDNKFRKWYGFSLPRNPTIMVGCVAMPLWWAYKYGNYRHKNLQVSD